MRGKTTGDIARGCLHGATLLLTAWALVATSAPKEDPVPARDCYDGVPSAATLHVTLGPAAADAEDGGSFDAADAGDDGPVEAGVEDAAAGGSDSGSADAGSCIRSSPSPYAPCATSCGGIDGLTPGATLVFDVNQGDRPQVYGNPPDCFGYATTAIQGTAGVSLATASGSTTGPFTGAHGSFVSPTEQGCRGDWSLDLEPRDPVMLGQLLSPLDAGVDAPWVVVRSINIPQAQFCGAAFAVRGAIVCGDVFPVDGITAGSAP